MAKNVEQGIIAQAQQKAVKAADPREAARKNMNRMIESMMPAIKAALPSVITPERFTRMVTTAISSNPALVECTPNSFLGAMMTAAQLGVEPNTPLGQAYLIPYNNFKKNCKECQFQLGYKGLIDLAYRSGDVTIIQAHTVYSNDTFEYELGLDPVLKHKPATSNRGEPIAYYAMFKTKSGGMGFSVMSREDVLRHRATYSKAKNSPWDTNFDEMAKKTVLKKALKYAPLKSDFVRGLAADETIKQDLSEDMLSVPSEYAEPDYVDEAAPTADPETGEVINA